MYKNRCLGIGKELKIAEEIIKAKPTDGLWDDGRTDESQLGLKYEEVEDAMNNPDSPKLEKYMKNKKIKSSQNGANSSLQDS